MDLTQPFVTTTHQAIHHNTAHPRDTLLAKLPSISHNRNFKGTSIAMPATTRPSKYPKFLPALAVAGTVAVTTAYIAYQFSLYRNVMDSRFAQANSPESEAKRRKTFEGTNSDPRQSFYNMLGR